MTFQAKKKFGELLIEEDKIQEQDLQRALGEQKKYGQKLGQVLFRMGLLSEDVIADALGRQLGISVAKLDQCDLPGDLIGLIPKNIARNCNVIPIERHYNWIRVAMMDPLDIAAMDEVAHFLRLEVIPSVATESEINRALERYYGMRRTVADEDEDFTIGQEPEAQAVHRMEGQRRELSEADSIEAITEDVAPLLLVNNEPDLPQRYEQPPEQQEPENALAEAVLRDDAMISPSVATLISQALSAEATDIHIGTGSDGGHIRMRVDGKLRTVKSFRAQAPSGMIEAIKTSAGLGQTAYGPGDGRFDFSRNVSVRVATCPTVNGERMVLRLVDKELSSAGLEGLGIAPEVIERLKKAFRQPGGLVLCAGPVGSGKTTTLYAIINHLNAMDKAIVTIEDPIEYTIDHVAQIQVDPEAGFGIDEGVRSMLRQDPDICVVGEVKERETAHLAIQAALAGITVLSTFCWNDAAGALVRLADMGLEPSLLASSVVCIIGQRLLRKICEGCKEAYAPPRPILESINVYETVPLYRGNGCPVCRNTGYRGRTAVSEFLFMDDELRNLILARAPLADIEKAAQAGNMRTMREDAVRKALLGITTLEEALNRTRTTTQMAMADKAQIAK
jgi:type IV pilus assembly protein PilB